MVACLRSGYVVLPCTEQLRAGDLRRRLEITRPAAIVCDERNRGELDAAGPDCPVLAVPDGRARPRARRGAARGAGPEEPVPDHVHERHRGRAQGRRARPALPRRSGAPGRALARRPRRRPRLVHGGQRLEQVGAQRLHRAVAARRGRAAARRALRPARAPRDPRARARWPCCAWRRPSSGVIAKRAEPRPVAGAARARRRRRGAQSRGAAPRSTRRPACGSATATARPRPGRRPACRRRGGPPRLDGAGAAGRPAVDRRRRAVRGPGHGPDVLPRLPAARDAGRRGTSWRTGDRVAPGRRRPAALRGPRGRRDHLRRLPDRAVRGRVGAASPTPPSPRRPWSPRPTRSAERSCARSSCCATASLPPPRLARELQEHVKAQTAPYKYPRHRRLRRRAAKTASGKIRRALLRDKG